MNVLRKRCVGVITGGWGGADTEIFTNLRKLYLKVKQGEIHQFKWGMIRKDTLVASKSDSGGEVRTSRPLPGKTKESSDVA